MRKGLAAGALLVLGLLAGCGAGARRPAPGIEGLLNQVRQEVKTNVEVAGRVPLKSGGELAVFTYTLNTTCGAGVAYADGFMTTTEGLCTDPVTPAMSSGETIRVVYGHLSGRDAGKVRLHWADGAEADAVLAGSAFYYVAEGSGLPQGQVAVTVYDRQGKVLHAPPPGWKEHTH